MECQTAATEIRSLIPLPEPLASQFPISGKGLEDTLPRVHAIQNSLALWSVGRVSCANIIEIEVLSIICAEGKHPPYSSRVPLVGIPYGCASSQSYQSVHLLTEQRL